MWKPVTISAMFWGHQGLLCRSELGLNEQGSKLLTFVIGTQEHRAVSYGGPFLRTSRLRMLRVPVAVMLPAWYGQGLALLSLAQSRIKAVHCPGSTMTVTPLDWHFLKELRRPRVAVHSLNTLQPHIHRFDSRAAPPTSVAASPALQKCKGGSSQT